MTDCLPMPDSMLEECGECMGEGIDRTSFISTGCDECEGEGILDEVTCDLCRGTGCNNCDQQGKLYNVTCPSCDAMGEIEFHPSCRECNGTGTMPSKEFYLV